MVRRTQNTLDMQIRLRPWRVRGAARGVKQNKMGMIEGYPKEYEYLLQSAAF